MVLITLSAALETVVLTILFAWWLADLIIFATNKRLSGNGCVLIDNL